MKNIMKIQNALGLFLIVLSCLITTTLSGQKLKLSESTYLDLKQKFDNSNLDKKLSRQTDLSASQVRNIAYEVCAFNALTPKSQANYMRVLTNKLYRKKSITEREKKLMNKMMSSYVNKDLMGLLKAQKNLLKGKESSPLIAQINKQYDQSAQQAGYNNAQDAYRKMEAKLNNMEIPDYSKWTFEDPTSQVQSFGDPFGDSQFGDIMSGVDLSNNNPFPPALNAAGGATNNDDDEKPINDDEELAITGIMTVVGGGIGAVVGGFIGFAVGTPTGPGVAATTAGGAATGTALGMGLGFAAANAAIGLTNMLNVMDIPCDNQPEDCIPGLYNY